MQVSMLLLASGRGDRLGSPVPKAFVRCAGRSLLVRSLARLAAITDDREIVVAVRAEDREPFLEPIRGELERLGLTAVVDGGSTRQESMRLALAASSADCPLVLVHDAARPFFPIAAARRAVTRAAEVGAALLAIPLPDTLKRADDRHRVIETIDRAGMWLAQTPQVARRELLVAALEQAARDGFQATDEASLLEHAGYPVEIVPGTGANLKITRAEDLEIAERIAALEDA